MKNISIHFFLTSIIVVLLTACQNKSRIDLNNPFFKSFDTPFNVPPFEKIMAKHYLPAFEKGMDECRAEIKRITDNREKPTFENTIETFDNCGALLLRTVLVFNAQAQANTNDSLMKVEMEISPKVSAFQDEVRLNPKLFQKIQTVYKDKSNSNLTDEQKFLLENIYLGFIRNGANLSKMDQDSLMSLNKQLSVLMVKFNQNVLKETNNHKLFITRREDLRGLPNEAVSAAAEEAVAAGFSGKWAFTTKKPSIMPFLSYIENRELRRDLYAAYYMRGNNGNESDNNRILANIIKLRAEHAKLLGYKSHAEFVLEPRMAKKPENVYKLLLSLWDKALPVALKEKEEMQKIADKEGGKFSIEGSDWYYYAEKLRKQKYDLNEGELIPFFKLENVRDGSFKVANRLFGITFEPVEGLPLPHPEAQGFEVKDSDGSHLGVLYTDFHTRQGKQSGAWIGPYASRHMAAGVKTDPVMSLVANFSRSTGDKPVLLTMDEVIAFFHEFGHVLDYMLNKNSFNPLFFETYKAWDFAEVPSQMMEKWAFEPEVLSSYAFHYKTNEVIPSSIIEKIKNSRYFNQGFETVEYLAASLLDLSYHTLEAPAIIDIQKFEKEYLLKIGLIPEILPRYRSTFFRHMTSGYDSGYYSYIWAAVLDNDAFEAFRENGLFDKKTAGSYRKNILEKNGTADAMKMFVNFRGREPVIDPLLKSRGLK